MIRRRGYYIELTDELETTGIHQRRISSHSRLSAKSPPQKLAGFISGEAMETKDITNSCVQPSSEESKSWWKPSRWSKKQDASASSDVTRIRISERPNCKQSGHRGRSKDQKKVLGLGSPRRRRRPSVREPIRKTKTMLTIEENEEFDLGRKEC